MAATVKHTGRTTKSIKDTDNEENTDMPTDTTTNEETTVSTESNNNNTKESIINKLSNLRKSNTDNQKELNITYLHIINDGKVVCGASGDDIKAITIDSEGTDISVLLEDNDKDSCVKCSKCFEHKDLTEAVSKAFNATKDQIDSLGTWIAKQFQEFKNRFGNRDEFKNEDGTTNKKLLTKRFLLIMGGVIIAALLAIFKPLLLTIAVTAALIILAVRAIFNKLITGKSNVTVAN